VDYLVRGQGEETLLELLENLTERNLHGTNQVFSKNLVCPVRGVTWKEGDQIIHNPDRPFRQPDDFPPLPYHKLGDPSIYLRPSFMGQRTAVHQAAIGCRYRCTFCGVVTMFNGTTKLSGPARLQQTLKTLRDDFGATAIQFYDNNFFDREDNSVPLLEAMGDMPLPYWCYARADTLAGFSARTWELIRKSQLRMAFIGAEASSDAVLKSMHKGTTVEHTFEVAARCREYGVIPEFSFVLGGPDDPEGEIEKTLGFIKRIKRIHPQCEVILYFYSPTPQRDPKWLQADANSPRPATLKAYGPQGPTLPTTPEEWTQPQWVSYVCHQDAPWLSPAMRQRVNDFARVLACRFPTVQDYKTPQWGKNLLKAASSWRYSSGRYDNPWELNLIQRAIPLRQPQKESL
jgi:anaerobic magnesium-protoporphyrin IX monomethyl ester cyclase